MKIKTINIYTFFIVIGLIMKYYGISMMMSKEATGFDIMIGFTGLLIFSYSAIVLISKKNKNYSTKRYNYKDKETYGSSKLLKIWMIFLVSMSFIMLILSFFTT